MATDPSAMKQMTVNYHSLGIRESESSLQNSRPSFRTPPALGMQTRNVPPKTEKAFQMFGKTRETALLAGRGRCGVGPSQGTFKLLTWACYNSKPDWNDDWLLVENRYTIVLQTRSVWGGVHCRQYKNSITYLLLVFSLLITA